MVHRPLWSLAFLGTLAATALAQTFQNPKAEIPPVAKQNRISGGESRQRSRNPG